MNSKKPARTDLTGMRFGRLTAIRPIEQRLNRKVVWECRCNCGNENMPDVEHCGRLVYVITAKLTSGHTQSCGCLQKEKAADIAKNKISDLTGQRFGRLIAVRATDKRKNNKVVWECKCDCGNTAYVIGTTLKNGNTSSCGCLRKENTARLGRRTGGSKPRRSCSGEGSSL